MPRRLSSIYHYVKCPDGKERVFNMYKTNNPDNFMTRGFVQVQEPSLGLKKIVPGWIFDNDPNTFIVDPNTVRANIFDEIKSRQQKLASLGYNNWKDYEASNNETIVYRKVTED